MLHPNQTLEAAKIAVAGFSRTTKDELEERISHEFAGLAKQSDDLVLKLDNLLTASQIDPKEAIRFKDDILPLLSQVSINCLRTIGLCDRAHLIKRIVCFLSIRKLRHNTAQMATRVEKLRALISPSTDDGEGLDEDYALLQQLSNENVKAVPAKDYFLGEQEVRKPLKSS